MLRAVALASRLDFAIDPPVLDAIRKHRHDIARSSPPRVLEECYKILRAGAAERSFRWLAELGLLEAISADLNRGAGDQLWRSLEELDRYRRQHASTPDTLTNPILIGTLIVPLGISLQARTRGEAAPGHESDGRPPGIKLGELPLARRDIERLRQILALQRRLRDLAASPRAQRMLSHRNMFRDALTWLVIQGGSPEVVEHWEALLTESRAAGAPGAVGDETERRPSRRRRRRGRRRFRPAP
jgi:poly(A) polymerase